MFKMKKRIGDVRQTLTEYENHDSNRTKEALHIAWNTLKNKRTTITFEYVEEFFMDWTEMKTTFEDLVLKSSGGLITTTKVLFNSDSQIRIQLGEEQHLFLQKDGETCFLDYFIDRRKYQEETINKLLQFVPDRDFEKLTYYRSQHIKQRNRITKKEELEADTRCFIKILQSINNQKSTEQHCDAAPVSIANEVSAEELLQRELVIPNYQRPYCWREENVRSFLDDIVKWQNDKRNDGVSYHIGTIILKKQVKNGCCEYDVIDGQQRLITLAILHYLEQFPVCSFDCKNRSQKCLEFKQSVEQKLMEKTTTSVSNTSNPKYCLPKKTIKKESERQTLLRARNIIQSNFANASKIKNNSNDRKSAFIDLSKVVLSVVIIGEKQPEDLAYTFFNNNNSTGKPLTDYDLLKTHHLRYLNNINAECFSKKWHDIEKMGIMDDLMQKMLFRLRNWKNREVFAFESARKDRHDVFDHFKSVDPFPDFTNNSFIHFRFDSLMSGGNDFFAYVDYYGKKYHEFVNLEIIQKLNEKLGGYSNGVICAGIKASAFLFFCKFGDYFLKEAVYLLAYRFSEMRNRPQIQCRYLSDCSFFSPIVQALDQSVSESQFFAILHDVRKRYIRTNTGEGKTNSVVKKYWESLDEFMDSISNTSFVSSIRISVMVQTSLHKEQEDN